MWQHLPCAGNSAPDVLKDAKILIAASPWQRRAIAGDNPQHVEVSLYPCGHTSFAVGHVTPAPYHRFILAAQMFDRVRGVSLKVMSGDSQCPHFEVDRGGAVYRAGENRNRRRQDYRSST